MGIRGRGAGAMTPGQARLGAVAAAVLGILGIYLSRRPTTDIAAGAIAGLAFLYFAVSSFTGDRRGRNARRAAERAHEHDRDARWERYSMPIGENFEGWEVGVVLHLSTGRRQQKVKRWPDRHPTLPERTSAELDADTRALEYNTAGWRPWE